MTLAGLAFIVGMAVIGLAAGPATAQGSRAFETCAKSALQQAMLVMSVERESVLRDRRGAVVGTKLDLRVNALGKKRTVSCYYTDATRVAVIRRYQPNSALGNNGNGSGNLATLRRDALRACQRASQQQGLMLETVVSQSDVRNRRGQITGSEVVINVYQSGRPARVICD